MKTGLVSALAALAACGEAATTPKMARDELAYSPPFYPSPWMNENAEGMKYTYPKAREIVSQMTLAEKVNLTTGVGWQGERCVGNTGSVPRLGLRGLCLQDGPVGIRFTDYNSVFPSGQLTAATWDRVLINQRARAMGFEAKGKGVDILLAPVAGPIGRIPAGGRNWEGFSPDPYLSGVAMAESSRGIRTAGVIACAKHFVGNEQEHFRQAGEAKGYGYDVSESMSSNIDDKTMHELYMWPFADAIRAGVGAIMCSYQQVNNSYGCANSKLMNNLLKDELGFQGFIMSDWQAQHTGVASAVAGLDMTMPGDTTFNSGLSFWGANLTLAVLNGTVPAWRLDDMVLRIVTSMFNSNMDFDLPDINFSSWTTETEGYIHYVAEENYEVVNQHVNVQDKNGDLIREIAAKGTVLLKNKGALPLNKPKFLAVIGEDAGPNPRGPNGCPDRGCNDGTLGMSWGSGTANFPYLITPDFALQEQARKDGTRYESILSNWENTATRNLVKQDNATAIVFVNANSGEGFIAVEDNQGDRANLTLWNGGDELIKNVSSLCSNTIVVIHSTGPVLVTDWYDSPNITAILWAGVPGQESGNSIADVLYGRINPAGRTPFTWGRTADSYGTKILDEANNGKGAPQDDFTEGNFIDYRYFDRASEADPDAAPIYEFGFGLSYTTFEYSDIKVQKHEVGDYTPTEGETTEAPILSNHSTDLSDYVFPDSVRKIEQFIYPYLSTDESGEAASGDPNYGQEADEFLPPGATDGSPQPLLRSSGQPGGHPALWDVLFTVTATITNTGDLDGDEVAQLYVSLGGEDEPVRVLRGFDRLSIPAGESVTFEAALTRRDLSNWDIVIQDWVITEHEKMVWVGGSSRNLPLKAKLDTTASPGKPDEEAPEEEYPDEETPDEETPKEGEE
ncbi:hypothetical protein jhhlp_002036 [Lomentospora prolificans]|uniref:Beta-glucosidase cel3A n=1 Tax=Lomentospora prolificans TaxID=41688 RepID=A0A2N3NCW4_9PEZI|nr:hypothetical protein jhhlp_002036 [Lomentospora prolificans]